MYSFKKGLLRGNPSTIVKATGVRVALVKMSELPFGTLFIRPVKVLLIRFHCFTYKDLSKSLFSDLTHL